MMTLHHTRFDNMKWTDLFIEIVNDLICLLISETDLARLWSSSGGVGDLPIVHKVNARISAGHAICTFNIK